MILSLSLSILRESRQTYGKATPFIHLALDFYDTTMRLNDVSYNRQSQASPACV